MHSQIDEQKSSKAVIRNVPISRKKGVELARAIRNKKLDTAYQILNDVIALKKAVPFKRYNMDKAHKPGIGPGGFPVKCATYFLKVLKNAEANALNKGLSRNDLYVSYVSVDKGETRAKSGRTRGRRSKSAHISLMLSERKTVKKSSAEKKKTPKKETKAKETKPKQQKTAQTKTKQTKSDDKKVNEKKDKVVNAHD